MRIRTGYSFKIAAGKIDDVIKRIVDIGLESAPITDRCSTFGFNRWSKACEKNKLRPIYGVELGCVARWGDAKPTVDYWTFLAINSIQPINMAVEKATAGHDREPSITYDMALGFKGVIKIAGERVRPDLINPAKDLYVSLSPSMPAALYQKLSKKGIAFVASSDNYYPTIDDREFYRVMLGRGASSQTYPQHILSTEEWMNAIWFASVEAKSNALKNARKIQAQCKAELTKADLLIPKKAKSLREMCLEGAKRTGTNLKDKVYKTRLDKELKLIEDRKFEDYFYIIADMITWAKKRMIVGPARGSSCGSLVCYLLDITTIDPIPFDLIFERFIDINRTDLPDIDIDFSDEKRNLVFEYAEEKYGKDHVARLGTVGLFRPKSVLNNAGMSLRVPKWLLDKVSDGLVERSGGDSRAELALEDTLASTDMGKRLLKEYPEFAIATRMEGHPHNASQHAAGIVITNSPVSDFVAIDSRTKSAMCDKKDAEDLNLLKIDALGLTQLSIFERALELIGEKPISGWLEKLPLDDKKAFEVLNKGHFSGIFQFMGMALQSLTKQIVVESLEDIVTITALARPGPMATGGAGAWVNRRIGAEKVTTITPLLTELTKDTYGIVVYQEQVMNIVRTLGKMSWEDTSTIRKAMSKSLGDEFFEKYWQKFKKGSKENGIEERTAKGIWDQVNKFGSWAFNRCTDGSTKVMMGETGGSTNKFITIKELYDKYIKNPTPWTKYHKPQAISLFPDGRAYPHRIKNIYKNGKKYCFKYIFSDGTKIICTPDHKFMINDKWKTIKEAIVGDRFLIAESEPTNYLNGKGKGHAKGNKYGKAQAGFPIGINNPGFDNGRTLKEEEFKERMKNKPCEDCDKKKKRMEVHHLDFKGGKKQPDKLKWLCAGCHKKRHYAAGRKRKWDKGYRTNYITLISSKDAGMRMTYDIEMEKQHNYLIEGGIVTHNSHAVAYGTVSYWCCYLKAYHPLEFAAATLDAQSDPLRQIELLRELDKEGIGYKAVDAETSTDRWAINKKKNILVGPLTQIKGIGPATVAEILECRKKNKPIRATVLKRLEAAKTEIDTLFPIRDKINELHEDLSDLKIVSKPWAIKDVQCGVSGSVMILAVVTRIAPRDENDAQNVQKRGYEMSGPTQALNMFFRDDTDEIFCKIDRYKYKELGLQVIERGRPGKSLYAIKGTVPAKFRMISVQAIKYLGDLKNEGPASDNN